MRALGWWTAAATATLLTAGTPALADGTLDAATFQAFGGTYLSDCGNNAAPKVTVFEDALVFLDGGKRIAGTNVQSAAGYYGQNTSPGYRTAILSEIQGGSQLIFVVSHDDAGDYITLDGDATVMQQIGTPLAGTKFRRCDPGAKQTTAAPAPAPTSASGTVDAGGMLLNPKFKAAHYKALGPLVKQMWLAKLDGPSPPTRTVSIGGREYVLVCSCKNHDCADNNAVLLYSPAFQVVYGKVYQRGRSSLIGAPPKAVARELERLWVAEWRTPK